MAEYIKREVAFEAITNLAGKAPTRSAYETVWKLARALKKIPVADVAPVVHGRWGTGRFNLETGNYEAQCIRCRNFSKEYGKPYCPNCGAKMDL
uniref:Putative toxin VapC6 domain, ZN ribbon domain n=1 Tax=Myoviridae sp. ctpvf97 TaxID=2825176 RepID=A0A8S5TW31_9CAUD|nr:MAG TPA: putative toxin VapC6 domain, ZN ribbon domain [Myoviridae sp. ctpvf97]